MKKNYLPIHYINTITLIKVIITIYIASFLVYNKLLTKPTIESINKMKIHENCFK